MSDRRTIAELIEADSLDDLRQFLASHPDTINTRDDSGYQPLHEAAMAGYAPMVTLLLQMGADPNETGGDLPSEGRFLTGVSSLHCACWPGPGKDAVVVQTLIEAGADLEKRDHLGRTALHLAACVVPLVHNKFDRDELFTVSVGEILVKYGADPGARAGEDLRNFTPLHSAAHFGRVRFAELLLRNGAEVNARDSGGLTPLDHVDRALGEGWGDCRSLLESFGGSRTH